MFLVGSCWRIKLWGLENCMRAVFVIGSGQRNITRRQDPNFLFFFFFFLFLFFFFFFLLCTQLKVSKYIFSLVGMSLGHIYTCHLFHTVFYRFFFFFFFLPKFQYF